MSFIVSKIRLARRSAGISEFWAGGIMDPNIRGDVIKAYRVTGDAWPASLLRLKSFRDLHCLWYILLKEKNFLLTERQYATTSKVSWLGHGRLKKVKLSMKRLLTVLSRREIHKQVVRAKEIRDKMEIREELEHRRFHLEEQISIIEHKIEKMADWVTQSAGHHILSPELENISTTDEAKCAEKTAEIDNSVLLVDPIEHKVLEHTNISQSRKPLMLRGWKISLEKYKKSYDEVMIELRPLRRDTMQCVTPDWRHSTTYSDLPGNWTWRKQWIRATENSKKHFARYH